MTKIQMITIAERNLKQAEKSLEHNINRSGITEQEKENLANKVKYAKIVRDLIGNNQDMTIDEMKQTILFQYHKSINYWYQLLGKVCEGTAEFTRPYQFECTIDGKKCFISWNNYNWSIVERSK